MTVHVAEGSQLCMERRASAASERMHRMCLRAGLLAAHGWSWAWPRLCTSSGRQLALAALSPVLFRKLQVVLAWLCS